MYHLTTVADGILKESMLSDFRLHYSIDRKMFIFKVIVIFIASSLIATQHLVLLGGNLKDDNAQIWNEMIELAVSFLLLLFFLHCIKKNLF